MGTSRPWLLPAMKDTDTLAQFAHLWRALADAGRPAAPDPAACFLADMSGWLREGRIQYQGQG